MKVIVLAAGYATRLYPLTENQPKPLLPVAGKPIIEHILDDLDHVSIIEEVFVVSNHKFIKAFEDWQKSYIFSKPVTIIDDGSTDNEHRLGAIRDIWLAIERHNIDEDILVLAGDNLFDFSLSGFINHYVEKKTDMIMVHAEENVEKLKKTGVAEVENGHIISFEEKPDQPKGRHAVPPFYIYKAETLPLIKTYIDNGNPADAPGSLIAWLCRRKTVSAYAMPGKRYDIGDLPSYEFAQKTFIK